jgi:hypothetical protein
MNRGLPYTQTYTVPVLVKTVFLTTTPPVRNAHSEDIVKNLFKFNRGVFCWSKLHITLHSTNNVKKILQTYQIECFYL